MKLKKFIVLTCSSVIALASLLSLGFGGEASATCSSNTPAPSATTLYWANASNSNFNNYNNWSTTDTVNSGYSNASCWVPSSGSIIVFDDGLTQNSSGIDPYNDMSNLDVNSISFVGSGPGGYNITPQTPGDASEAITVDAGITDSSTGGVTNVVSAGVNLNGNQNISISGTDNLDISGLLNVGTSTANFSSMSETITLSNISGSGSLNFASPSSGVAKYVVNAANTGYSGSVTINSDANVSDTSGSLNGLGSGTITIDSAGSLTLNSTNASGTLANNLVLSGSGDGVANYGALVSCLGGNGCAGGTVYLTGSITLGGNTKLVNGAYTPGNTPGSTAVFDVLGKYTPNGYGLVAVSGSGTSVVFPGSGKSNAPSSPDSGEGLVSNRSQYIFIGTVLLSSSLVILGCLSKRRSEPSK